MWNGERASFREVVGFVVVFSKKPPGGDSIKYVFDLKTSRIRCIFIATNKGYHGLPERGIDLHHLYYALIEKK